MKIQDFWDVALSQIVNNYRCFCSVFKILRYISKYLPVQIA